MLARYIKDFVQEFSIGYLKKKYRDMASKSDRSDPAFAG
jgi:hypothetical protein